MISETKILYNAAFVTKKKNLYESVPYDVKKVFRVMYNFLSVTATDNFKSNLLSINDVPKVVDTYQLHGRFLRSCVKFLEEPVSEICNFSIFLDSFFDA